MATYLTTILGTSSAASTTAAVDLSSRSVGEYALVLISRADTSTPSSTPSGWTLLQSHSSTQAAFLYGKVLESGDIGTVTWSGYNSVRTLVRATLYGGIDPTTPVEASTKGSFETGSGQTLDFGSVTTSQRTIVLVASAYLGSIVSGDISSLSGYVERADFHSTTPDHWQLFADTNDVWAGGASSPSTGTNYLSASSTYRGAFMVVLQDHPGYFAPTASNHDAWQANTGAMTLTSSSLNIDGAARWGGLYVDASGAPDLAGATVDAATLYYYPETTSYDDPKVDWYGEAADTVAVFTTTNYNISSRDMTTATTSDDATAVGLTRRAVDITAIIQEIVERPGWADSIVLIGDGLTDSTLRLLAFDRGYQNWWIEIYYTPAGGTNYDEAVTMAATRSATPSGTAATADALGLNRDVGASGPVNRADMGAAITAAREGDLTTAGLSAAAAAALLGRSHSLTNLSLTTAGGALILAKSGGLQIGENAAAADAFSLARSLAIIANDLPEILEALVLARQAAVTTVGAAAATSGLPLSRADGIATAGSAGMADALALANSRSAGLADYVAANNLLDLSRVSGYGAGATAATAAVLSLDSLLSIDVSDIAAVLVHEAITLAAAVGLDVQAVADTVSLLSLDRQAAMLVQDTAALLASVDMARVDGLSAAARVALSDSFALARVDGLAWLVSSGLNGLITIGRVDAVLAADSINFVVVYRVLFRVKPEIRTRQVLWESRSFMVDWENRRLPVANGS